MWLIDVLLIVYGQQWSCMGQRKKIFRLLVSRINSLLVWVLSWGLLTITKIKNNGNNLSFNICVLMFKCLNQEASFDCCPLLNQPEHVVWSFCPLKIKLDADITVMLFGYNCVHFINELLHPTFGWCNLLMKFLSDDGSLTSSLLFEL